MIRINTIALAILFVIAITMLLLPKNLDSTVEAIPVEEPVASTPTSTPLTLSEIGVGTTTLSHQQEVWLYVLEWCESRGYTEAVNEIDLDGTASYGAFQFKPGTFETFRLRYELPEADFMDYAMQKEIVTRMIGESENIQWEKQFPWCVRDYGRPPV